MKAYICVCVRLYNFYFHVVVGSHKELCNELVKRLQEEGAHQVMLTLSEEMRTAIKERISGYNRDDAIRKRVQGMSYACSIIIFSQ